MRLTTVAWIMLYFLALPVIGALLELDPLTAFLGVLLGLMLLWGMRMRTLLNPAGGSEMHLDTISASHFVEKVRWCMDRLGVPYKEVPNAGVIGVFTVGRTVPRLRVRTGSVESSIGNSSDILRYLWGRYGLVDPRAGFLEPGADALALEKQMDHYGLSLQRWIYHNIIRDRELTLQAWGANDPKLPGWQRLAVRVGFPVLRGMIRRAFRLSDRAHRRVLIQISEFLQSMEDRLADGRRTLLGGDQISFVDLTLAGLSGIWLQPPGYGGGQAEGVRLSASSLPQGMIAEMQQWREQFPRVVALVERLYREERGGTQGGRPAEPASSSPSAPSVPSAPSDRKQDTSSERSKAAPSIHRLPRPAAADC
ncbi:MAG: glutathione S-transferase C-terminal domain-containing protein [Gammaproteobacteria bacterium]